MPTVIILAGNIKIEVYSKDHNPPHIHAIYAEYEVLIEIKTGNVYSGDLPGKKLRIAREYVLANQTKLLALWNLKNQSTR